MVGTSKRVTRGDEYHPSKKRHRTLKKAINSTLSTTLCDDVIDHIISFLPISKASQTAILGKRFEQSWMYSKHLHFYAKLSKKFTQIEVARIVNRAITFHRGSTIESLHLCMNAYSYEYLIPFWLKLILAKKPKVVELDFSIGRSYLLPVVIPSHLLDIESIETLKFSCCMLDLTHKFVGLHFLRTLVLRHIRLESSLIRTIIENCSLLECMDIAKCHNTFDLKIDVEDLKFFKVLKLGESNELGFLDVNAPILEVFHFVGEPQHIGFQSVMPKLCDVVLKLKHVYYGFSRQSIQSLLQRLSHASTLIVTSTILEGQNMTDPQHYFWHVKELQLMMEPLSFCNPYDILKFIDKCPHLERLFIDLKKYTFDENNMYWNLHDCAKFAAHDQHFSYLKVLKLSNFKYNHLEMALVKCFLEKSPKLENLGIFTSKKYHRPKISPEFVNFLQQLKSWKSSLNANVGVYESKDGKEGVFSFKHQDR